MTGPNENGPSVTAPEPLDQQIPESSIAVIADTATTVNIAASAAFDCPLHVTPEECGRADVAAAMATLRGHAAGYDTYEAEPEPASRILKRIESPKANATVAHLPAHGPSGAHQVHALFWRGPIRDERIFNALLQLHRRGLLPFNVPTLFEWAEGWQLGLDTADDPSGEMVALWQRKLDRVSWAFPWRLAVVALSPSMQANAEMAGLGLFYPDDAPIGGGT